MCSSVKVSRLFLWLLTATIVSALFFTEAAIGQYFGKNKVQYQDFDFNIIESENYQVYYYPQEKTAAIDATSMLERWYSRYAELFGYKLSQKQKVILYANHADFQQTNVISGRIPQATGGVTEGMRQRIVLPLTGVYKEDNHVLGHELVHGFQYDIMKQSRAGLQASRRMPLWFIEGMAEYMSIGRNDALTAMWMRDAVLHDDVPTVKEMTRGREYFPYRYGHAMWGYITGRWGDAVLPRLFNAVMNTGWERASKAVLGFSSDSLSTMWQNTLTEYYEPQLEGRTHPDSLGEKIITGGAGTNLSPVISPNGDYVAFISRRELFTMDLYVADAETGEVLGKLVSSNTDAHFDALRYMDSAGSWSPDSKSFAFVVFDKGDNQIAIADAESQKIKRTSKIQDVDAIQNLAWSPDGEHIVFNGTYGGVGNLYLYNVQSEEVTQLTDDLNAEVHPAWSPNGNTIAFATDRGAETSFRDFTFSTMNIGLLNIETGNVQLITMKDGARHINPQFSPDGDDLFFISDADGYSDVYRFSMNTGQYYRVTKVATGISGLTEMSHAMSVDQQAGRMVFSVFNEKGQYIHALPPQETTGEIFNPAGVTARSIVSLPPVNGVENSVVENYMASTDLGLEPQSTYDISEYQSKLELIYVGQSGAGISVSSFGVGLGGGVNFLFGDMLGNQMVSATAQVNGGFKDIGGQVYYLNRDNRLNWGGIIGHIPYRSAGTTRTAEGDIAIVNQRVFYDRIAGILEYPFSQNRRMEFTTGFTRISYDYEARIYDFDTGETRIRELPQPDPLNLVQTSIAYVGDYSFMGFTSPINGKRFRFELEPNFGSLRYMAATADYRNYAFANPFTFAFRLMHYGRYLKDAEDTRQSSLYLGYETLVRGYNASTFSSDQRTQTDDIAFENIVGSRIGLFNAEVRVPLFGTEEYGLINARFLPTELLAFVDGGVAWTKSEQPNWEWTTTPDSRVPVFSAGIGARVNLFGYLVGQVYYAYPFQRPEQGAHFGFVIAPGW